MMKQKLGKADNRSCVLKSDWRQKLPPGQVAWLARSEAKAPSARQTTAGSASPAARSWRQESSLTRGSFRETEVRRRLHTVERPLVWTDYFAFEVTIPEATLFNVFRLAAWMTSIKSP